MKRPILVTCALFLFLTFGCSGERALGDPTATPDLKTAKLTTTAPTDAKPPTAAPAAAPEVMLFGWPVPALARVREASTKKGLDAELEYELHVCAQGEDLVIHYRNFKFQSIKGLPADGPDSQQVIAQLTPILGTLPALVINKEGQYTDMQGWEEAKAATLTLLPEPQRSQVAKMLDTPHSATLMHYKMSDLWGSWVSGWRAYELQGPPEQVFVSTHTSPTPMEVELTIARLPSADGTLHLRMESAMDKTQLRPALKAMLAPLLKSANLSTDEMTQVFEEADLQRVDMREVVTDPRTLRPIEVKTEMKTQLTLPGQAPNARIERHHYKFDWNTGKKPTCP